jgi:hypothetical protein
MIDKSRDKPHLGRFMKTWRQNRTIERVFDKYVAGLRKKQIKELWNIV